MNKDSNKEEIVQYFLDHPQLIRESKAKWVSDYYKIDLELVRGAFKEAKERSGIVGKKKTAGEYIEQYLDKHNLELSDVKNIKIYGNPDKPLLSIATKNEWYGSQGKEFLEQLEELLREYKSPEISYIKPEKTDCIGVLNLLDAHIDKITLVRETGYGSSLEENIAVFEAAFDSLLAQTLCKNPEYIIIVVGSDFYNTNDANNTTKKGTPQNTEPDWKNSFLQGYKLYRRCIDKALKYTSVILKVVQGNHDEDKIFHLGQMLEVTYENIPHITIDSSCIKRKYHNYGNSLLGFGHGDIEKKFMTTLPATMMIENKHLMPQIEHMHFYLGDIHHREQKHFDLSKDLKGCEVTFLRALSNVGKWEFNEGYIGIPKSAECFIHDKKRGMINNIRVHI